MKQKTRKGKAWKRFLSSDRFHGNVVLNFMRFPKGELAAYGRSYREAATHLVEHMASSHYRDPDACPIVFLYRHAVELYLKSLIHWGNNLLRLNGKPIAPHKNIFAEHRLGVLLKCAKPILRFQKLLTNWGVPEFDGFRDAEVLIRELEQFDPGSYSFRYPNTTKGRDALPHHFVFNVVEFGEKFDQLIKIFDWLSEMTYLNFQSEAEAYHEMQQL
jgi:hypothetical protein